MVHNMQVSTSYSTEQIGVISRERNKIISSKIPTFCPLRNCVPQMLARRCENTFLDNCDLLLFFHAYAYVPHTQIG